MDKSPSEGFTLEELRSEFDWMFEFQSRMAEYIRNDPDVHSLAGYVSKLEEQNAKLRELVRDMCKAFIHGPCYRWCEHMPEPCNGDKCQYVRRMRELGVDA